MDQFDDIEQQGKGDAEGWRRERFEHQMTRCRNAWQAGVSLAVKEAVTCCRIYQRPPPEWLDLAVATVIDQRRSKEEAQQHYNDMLHYVRWDAVRELQARAAELCELALRRHRDERSELDLALIRGWRPAAVEGEQITLDACFEAVSILLRGTAARGVKETVERSYSIVEHAIEAGQGAKYFLITGGQP
jgi:hypothetical protein